jgi:hypothetical protein
MKSSLSRSLPLLSLLLVGLAACDEPTTGSGGPTPAPPTIDPGGGGGTPDEDGEPLPVPSRCAEPTGAPTQHGKNIETDETWGAGVHDVIFDIGIRKNATLTIEPCAVVRVVASRGFIMGTVNAGDGGKLVAKGKADLPIVFEGKDGARWTSLLVYPQGQADLAYVTLKDAGATGSRGGAALHVVGDQTKPVQELATVDHVTIEGSLKYGAYLESRGAFTKASNNLIVKGSGNAAVRAAAPTLSTVPTGKYTGNAIDAIRIGNDIIEQDVTIHDRGVPYVVGGDGQFNEMSVMGKDGTAPVLTIEAGVTLKFGKLNSGLYIERFSTTSPARGVLRVLGTADRPVVFTSNEPTPAAGDWVGIVFRGIPNPQSKIDYARVEYAGADTGTANFSCGTPMSPVPNSNEAAIAIYGQPSSAFVTNTVISKSAANAFERGWFGTPVDFLATNTLTEVAYCKQTYPRPPTGSCPSPTPCE